MSPLPLLDASKDKMRFRIAITLVLVLLGAASAQTSTPAPTDNSQTPTIRTKSNVVLVPTLVKDDRGEVIYGLTAKDFAILDDGVEQKVRLDDVPESEPVSLVVAVQRGGRAGFEFERMRGLATMLQPLMEQGKTSVALVEFDSNVELITDFTGNAGTLDAYLKRMMGGNGGSAILDATMFSVNLLEAQPKEQRRVLLLISETRDHGSLSKLKDTVMAIQNSNTVVYSLSFSPTVSNFNDTMQGRNEAEVTNNMDFVGPVLMSVINAMKKNVPKTVAELTGGEYELFKSDKAFDSLMNSFDNHLNSRYLLSFDPKDPHTGMHTVKVGLRGPQKASVLARTGYWVQEDGVSLTDANSAVANTKNKTVTESNAKNKSFHTPDRHDMFAVNEGSNIEELDLSDGESAQIVSVIQGGMPRDMASAKSADAMKAQLLVRRVNIGEGAQNGLAVVIKYFCNAKNNDCSPVLFRKVGAEWKLVDWSGDGPEAARFTFVGPTHKGLYDLVVEKSMNGGKVLTQVWRYNGKAYKNTGLNIATADPEKFLKVPPANGNLPTSLSGFHPPEFKDQNFSHQGLPLNYVGLSKNDIAQLADAIGKSGVSENAGYSDGGIPSAPCGPGGRRQERIGAASDERTL